MSDLIPLPTLIDTVLATLDARDPYTYEHSFRVARYAEMMAHELELPSAICQQIQVASLLHDIGKIAIPDHVLNKAGRLNREEMLEIQRHPRIGCNILGRLPKFREITTIVLHHHERFDGKGYPEQLAGEQIPMESRIIAVADSFDAMTSNRPYRKAMTVDAAIDEVSQHAGEQFDPAVAASLARLRDQVGEHLSRRRAPINGGHHAYVGHEDLMHSRIVHSSGFFTEDGQPLRHPVPSTLFGREWTRNLYTRYHALQHKANRKGIPFQWNRFADFLTALAIVAPDEPLLLRPEAHRCTGPASGLLQRHHEPQTGSRKIIFRDRVTASCLEAIAKRCLDVAPRSLQH
jgi:putative nucleotidyltransferase with HDIG domain